MKEARFKVGDRVMILDGSTIVSDLFWSKHQGKFVGRIGEIIKIHPYRGGHIYELGNTVEKMFKGESGWKFDEKWLAEVPDDNSGSADSPAE